MSDASSFDDVEGTPDLVPRAHIRDLEAKARRTDELEAQLAQVTKDAAFAQAFGPSTDPRLDYFRRGYQGDVNPDAIRQAATEAGFLAAVSQPAPTAPTADLSAHQRMASASSGAEGPGQITWQDALAEADRITNEDARTAAILDVVERYGGTTSRTTQ